MKIGSLLLGLTLLGRPLTAQEPAARTPRAGDVWTGTVLGLEIDAPARDRGRVTALNLGVYPVPGGPEERTLNPWGALYLYRSGGPSASRLRAVLVGIVNEIRYDSRPSPSHAGLSTVLTLDSVMLPFARSEYVEGERIAEEELSAHNLRAGFGVAYRRPAGKGHVDNGLELSLTYEPGALLLSRGKEAAPSFVVPRDTYEGRLHGRVRFDALERNLIELPHEGLAYGLDVVLAHRAGWDDWGGPVTAVESGSRGRVWTATSGFALWAAGLSRRSERHRLVASVHAGVGARLDRLSAFRLGGASTYGDAEAISHVVLPGAGTDEIFSTRYCMLDLEYRYEALPFLYLQARGGWALADRLRRSGSVPVELRFGSLPSVSVGVTSGFLWSTVIELGAAYSFGLSQAALVAGVAREF